MRISNHRNRRAGNVLLLFALLTFVIFAVAALVIDLGMARLAHREMQGATDSAALEGLRYRDDVPPWISDKNSAIFQQIQNDIGVNPSDPAHREQVRRWMARNQINLTFTDGVDPVTGNPVQFGAGPMFQISSGVGESNALQTITVPASGVTVYKPNVQLNNGNFQSGDMVSGTFSFVPYSPLIEAADYTRSDFISLAPGNSFLIRLRRTKDTQGRDRNALDDQPGISTTGPALPLIFGQGSLIAGADPTAGYAPRHHGIAVRGTAIAQGRPVLAAGAAIDSTVAPPGMRGVATFAISLTDWTTFSTANAIAYTPPPGRTTILVGDILTGPTVATLPAATSNQVYVPIVNDGTGPIGVPTGMVLGFGSVSYNANGTLSKNGGNPSSQIASENATASTAVLRLIPDLIDPVVLDVLTNLMSSTNPNANQFLLAPALVR